ncbi:receptor-like protein kinase [Pyrus ussuriensis x Pyrus communis]|uniref:Receptor-like protein kinase n=1 Tax=Pyrus ussuriensis x Pyrus communis TaxID=2448454 RepID=A0A5N5GV48_9ROSA|nr:receptor-like protein kinase [Pyrus ussuriensis x Pyrus communis]
MQRVEHTAPDQIVTPDTHRIWRNWDNVSSIPTDVKEVNPDKVSSIPTDIKRPS